MFHQGDVARSIGVVNSTPLTLLIRFWQFFRYSSVYGDSQVSLVNPGSMASLTFLISLEKRLWSSAGASLVDKIYGSTFWEECEREIYGNISSLDGRVSYKLAGNVAELSATFCDVAVFIARTLWKD